MKDFNGYYIFNIFSKEQENVKYIRQDCLISTIQGIVKGYLFLPINLNGALPITTTQRNGDVMFTFIKEGIKRVEDNDDSTIYTIH